MGCERYLIAKIWGLGDLWALWAELNEVKGTASTVMEAENPRSSKIVNMGIYGLGLTSCYQIDQKGWNLTEIGELLLYDHLELFDILDTPAH